VNVSSVPVITHYAGQDARRLAARIWQSSDAIADVVYLHGIVSHGGWYESSCAFLAANGFQVHFLERRGSGLNPDSRGDVDDWTTWLSDVAIYLNQLPQNRPRILLGVSWGGVLATSLARRHPELISGFGLICPGLFSNKAANRAQRLGLRLAGMLGLNRVKVQVPLQDPALFTDSPEAQRYIAQDPLTLRKITIRMARCNLELLRHATEAPEEIEVPVLLMLSSRDPITQNQRTREFVGRVGHRDQTIIEYADASHTLEFEDDPSQYFQDLNAWCSRIAKGSC
jgi:alpha-beta hydrolase superfamily lysophospholipase